MLKTDYYKSRFKQF